MAGLFAVNTRIRYRFNQVRRQLEGHGNAETDHAIRALLPSEQWQLVARLSPADRNHLLGVHRELVRLGYTNADLLSAALLHDIGKADDHGRRVRLVHRILKVILRWVSPGLLRSISEKNAGWVTHGMFLAIHHPVLGAILASEAGASERTCWLIAHHDDDTIHDDEELTALRIADEKE